MVRLFGFLLAVAGLASQSNAALLVKYDFTGANAAARIVATSKATGVVASDFAGNGNASTAGFWTGTTNLSASVTSQGGFTLTTTEASGFAISKVVYQFRATANTTANRTQTVALKLSSGESSTTNQLLGSSPRSNSLTLGSTDFDPVIFYSPIGDLGPLGFDFTSTFGATANNNAKFQLDYVEVYGELVPEPASMAIFGLLAAPVAFRRLRRKS